MLYARAPLSTASLLALALVLPAAAQDKPVPGKVPERGDRVVAEGCFVGATLDAASIKAADGTSALETPLNYQLKGDKGVLKQMREESRGLLVRVTGTLKSKLPDPDSSARKVGKTTITLGVSPSPYDRNAPMAGRSNEPPQPVLDVDGYQALRTRCR